MRIGIDARVLAHQPTGVARYLRALLGEYEAVREPGESLELYVDGQLESPTGTSDARVSILRWPLPGGDPAWRQLRLAARLARDAPDVLFCPFYSIPLLATMPRVVTIHDVSFLAHPEWFSWRARAAFRLVGPSARRAARVLTVSQFSAGEIHERLGVPRERIEVVAPGIDAVWTAEPSLDERREAREWLGTEGPYVLHLGAIHERRNPETVLAAFAQLAARLPELRFVVAGPALDASWERAAAAAAGPAVVRREWVPERHLRALIAESAALVYLSSYEGFGLPALEAAACGTPVVALRRASLPEVLGDAAAWVEEPDADEVAAVLERVLTDAAASRALAERSRQRALRFPPRSAAAATFAVLRAAAH